MLLVIERETLRWLSLLIPVPLRSKTLLPTNPHHQPLRSPRRRHIKHPRRPLLVPALRRHLFYAEWRHHGELQAFADLHAYNLGPP